MPIGDGLVQERIRADRARPLALVCDVLCARSVRPQSVELSIRSRAALIPAPVVDREEEPWLGNASELVRAAISERDV